MNEPSPPSQPPAKGSVVSHEWLAWLVPVGVVLTIVAIVIGWRYVRPAPPSAVAIATGPKTGAYYAIATKYAEFFKANGVTLDVRETDGSVDNYSLLTTSDSGVDLAFVQPGTAPPAEKRPDVQAAVSIYLEPVLVFYRGEPTLAQLSQLAGRRIAIGPEGSGVRAVARRLLDEAGVAESATLQPIGNVEAADALTAGTIDAAFFVISPDSPVIARLLATPGVRLMSLDHARAYGRRHAFLAPATLFRGSVDPRRDLPASDVELVAAPTTLAVRSTTHQAIVQLLVRAAQEHNRDATLLADAGTFPSEPGTELPLNSDAQYFLKNPPNILHRTLPFWLASLVDRLIILILPMLVVLIPLIRIAPPIYAWRTQRKLLARYRRVREIERDLTESSPTLALQKGVEELQAMDAELATLKLPIAYAKDLYELRTSLAYVRRRLEGWSTQNAADAADAPEVVHESP